MAAQVCVLGAGAISIQATVSFKDLAIAPVSASAPIGSSSEACPVCQRIDSLVRLGDAIYCAACGYASDGAAGCT